MRHLTDGSTSIVRGALAAGCDFFAGYPITPASGILMGMLRELPRTGGVGIQAEDEIAAIGMCIGAAMSGARAMTATSGPGMSLLSENVGLAIMGEVPLVIVDVQRLGPATGGATTVGQGDVQFVRWGTSGGYPIIALAPSSIGECYTLTRRAFELAARFRVPVFVLIDKELGNTRNTVDARAFAEPSAGPRNADPIREHDGAARPYRFEPPGEVPPLTCYGDVAGLRFTGSTHDERAFITKDPATVDRLNRHLAAKIDLHAHELELTEADLDPEAETLFVSYGVTAGAMREAVRQARELELEVSALTIQSLWPVPEAALRRALGGVRRVLVAELNLGQYRREVERLARDHEVVGLHRVDGGLIAPERFLEALQ